MRKKVTRLKPSASQSNNHRDPPPPYEANDAKVARQEIYVQKKRAEVAETKNYVAALMKDGDLGKQLVMATVPALVSGRKMK